VVGHSKGDENRGSLWRVSFSDSTPFHPLSLTIHPERSLMHWRKMWCSQATIPKPHSRGPFARLMKLITRVELSLSHSTTNFLQQVIV
jgi:hypothetical protein